MKHILLSTVIALTASSAFAAETAPAENVKQAVDKLNAAANYSWTTTIKMPDMPFEPSPVKGSTEKDGLSKVSQDFNENTIEAVFKGDKVVVKDESGWQLLNAAEGMGAMMGGWLTANGTAGQEAAKLLKYAKALKAGEDGLISGDLTEEGAKDLLTFRTRDNTPPPPKDAKGSVKFWIKDNSLAKFESHVQGKVSFGMDQEERDFQMTRTVDIQKVGSTKVDVPDEARKKLESK